MTPFSRYFRARWRLGVAGAALLAALPAAQANIVVGDRVFPTTLTIDDPGVDNELALPAFTYMTQSGADGARGPIALSFGGVFSKTLTDNLGFSVGSEGYVWQRRPNVLGWSNLETELKFVPWLDEPAQAIVGMAVAMKWASPRGAAGAETAGEPYSTASFKLFAGKGFGDAQADWVKPLALTGEYDLNVPLSAATSDGTAIPTAITYGATLQYSLEYMNDHVRPLPPALRELVPAFEAIFTTPVSNLPRNEPGAFGANVTTGVVGPSLYYVGKYFEIGAMAQIPINPASGAHIGALAVIAFFLDDAAPDTFGRPLFGAAAAEAKRF
ncbi:MAG TPA: hypothetical protein VMU18_02160 [Rhodoblastus sp.]|nr:hypothetical protein [Rhodoblastus sp.]